MPVNSIGNGADLLGAIAQLGLDTTDQAASMNVLKKALEAQASVAADLASLVAEVTGSGGQLNVYA